MPAAAKKGQPSRFQEEEHGEPAEEDPEPAEPAAEEDPGGAGWEAAEPAAEPAASRASIRFDKVANCWRRSRPNVLISPRVAGK